MSINYGFLGFCVNVGVLWVAPILQIQAVIVN